MRQRDASMPFRTTPPQPLRAKGPRQLRANRGPGSGTVTSPGASGRRTLDGRARGDIARSSRMRRMASSSPTPKVPISTRMRICRMLCYTSDELIGMDATDIVVPTEFDQIGLALTAGECMTGREENYRNQERCRDGVPRSGFRGHVSETSPFSILSVPSLNGSVAAGLFPRIARALGGVCRGRRALRIGKARWASGVGEGAMSVLKALVTVNSQTSCRRRVGLPR